jgi:hypothetical protein
MADSLALETQGVTLEIETGTGSPISTVTAAVGYPTIITKNAHGLQDGDIVALSDFAGTDAALMNGKTVVVKNVTTNTLAVDIDTTGKTLTAANGTLTPVEFTEIGEVTDFDGPSGSASIIDVSHLKSTRKEKRIGLPDEGQVSISVNLVPGDAGQIAVRTSRDNRTKKNYRLTLTDDADTTLVFAAFCMNFSTSGAVDGKIAGKIGLEITGAVAWS